MVESGLTDRVLDDPLHPYTQLLVSSVLQEGATRQNEPYLVGRVSEAPPGKKRHEAKMIHVENVSKTFVLHQQNGVRLPVLQNASEGEQRRMRGAARPLRQRKIHPAALLYANYLPDEGHIHIRHADEWVDWFRPRA